MSLKTTTTKTNTEQIPSRLPLDVIKTAMNIKTLSILIGEIVSSAIYQMKCLLFQQIKQTTTQ